MFIFSVLHKTERDLIPSNNLKGLVTAYLSDLALMEGRYMYLLHCGLWFAHLESYFLNVLFMFFFFYLDFCKVAL